jgi:plasmid maintenance system antidote protein VapI
MKSVLGLYLEYLNESVLTPDRLLKWLKTFKGTPAELQKVINSKLSQLDSKKNTLEKLGKLRKIDPDKVFAMIRNIEVSKNNWINLQHEYVLRTGDFHKILNQSLKKKK